jgi:hypothetical protein
MIPLISQLIIPLKIKIKKIKNILKICLICREKQKNKNKQKWNKIGFKFAI